SGGGAGVAQAVRRLEREIADVMALAGVPTLDALRAGGSGLVWGP
ncbi:alpha-hydroxy-acid oxidizing protein, partial [Ameyamaea chiangmaiensis]|nr:alpha-hydroxy-acid oxidizing protein [Ameyamaea chiangmaiensis]